MFRCDKDAMKTVAKCVTLFILLLLGCGWYFIFTLLKVNTSMDDTSEKVVSENVTNLYSLRKTIKLCNNSSRKYVIGLSYWEQLNMAVRNMFQLVIVANDWGSRVVEPYTLNSRLYGLRNFVLKREVPAAHNNVPIPLKELVDINKLNTIICDHGLPHLVSMQEFIGNSAELVIVVHYVHYYANPNDLNVPADVKDDIATQFNIKPVIDCRSLLDRYVNKISYLLQQETEYKRHHMIKHYYCVDATKLISTEKLARMIGITELDEFTVVVVDWHGYSKNSMVYHSAKGPHVNKRATLITSYKGPSFAAVTLPHSQRVMNATKQFLLYSKITDPFIAVHIRSEKIGHVQQTHKGYASSCMKEMLELIEQLKKQYDISNVVICTDFGEGASDTCVKCRGGSEISHFLHDHHLNIIRFDPTTIGEIHDSGFIAFVDMNVLSRGYHLIAVGGGSFQNQTMQNFIHYHSINYTTRIHEICTKR